MSAEKRKPREHFTRVLKKIAERFDNKSVYEISWTNKYVEGTINTRMRLKSLWVFGSYARGALTCGDLDLVAEVMVEEGILPLDAKVTKTVLGAIPGVRLYFGSPDDENFSHNYPEAKLVWSSQPTDWNANIDAIRPDPSASRYARKSDLLPVRLEQIAHDEEESLKIIEDYEQGIISWSWVPIDAIALKSDAWTYDSKRFAEYLQRNCGKKTIEAMHYVIEWVQQNICREITCEFGREKCRFKAGGTEIFVGCPVVKGNLLDSLSCSQLVISPHLSQRGPNGLWVIIRGENHPIEKAFLGRGAYYLTEDGSPWILKEVARFEDRNGANCIELFSSFKSAKKLANEINKSDGTELQVAYASGTKLLDIISCCDVIDIDNRRFSITIKGKIHNKHIFEEEAELSTIEDICSALVSSESPPDGLVRKKH